MYTHTRVFVCVHSVAQLYLTLCKSMDCSLPGSSVHGVFQERILEWVAISKAYPNFNAYSHLGVTPAGLRRFPPILY